MNPYFIRALLRRFEAIQKKDLSPFHLNFYCDLSQKVVHCRQMASNLNSWTALASTIRNLSQLLPGQIRYLRGGRSLLPPGLPRRRRGALRCRPGLLRQGRRTSSPAISPRGFCWPGSTTRDWATSRRRWPVTRRSSRSRVTTGATHLRGRAGGPRRAGPEGLAAFGSQLSALSSGISAQSKIQNPKSKIRLASASADSPTAAAAVFPRPSADSARRPFPRPAKDPRARRRPRRAHRARRHRSRGRRGSPRRPSGSTPRSRGD